MGAQTNKSLRSLPLNTCDLYGGTWAELVPLMIECFHLTDARLQGLGERNGEYAWRRANEESDRSLRLPEAEHYLVHGGENPFTSGVLELEGVEYL
jgi:hypothetical protein